MAKLTIQLETPIMDRLNRLVEARERQAVAIEKIANWLVGADEEEMTRLRDQLKASGDALQGAVAAAGKQQ